MSRFCTKTLIFLAFLSTVACGDNQAGPDAGVTPTPDAAQGTDGPVPADAAPPDAPFPPDNLQMTLDAPDGVVDPAIEVGAVLVTYTKPAIGNDVAGFFVQREMIGPALFVAIDPVSLDPVPATGDRVSFSVTEMDTSSGLRQAVQINNWEVRSSGNDISGLVQDVSGATDLVSALDDYTSELVTVTGTLTGNFGFAGSGHSSATIDTAGIVAEPNNDLRFRVPDALLPEINLAVGCSFTTAPTPLWRFNTQAQAHLWAITDIASGTCSPPVVVNAVSLSDTQVVVRFDRAIAAASVNDPVNQFMIDNGLTVSQAEVNGREVVLTTATQVGGTAYTVTVESTVLDILGAGVDPANNSAGFNGYQAPATVRINEVRGGDNNDDCDKVELRVIGSGTLEGFELFERGTSVFTFPAVSVQTNDFIVVHWANLDCNPNGAVNEINAPDEQPQAMHPTNYDTAFDFHIADTHITNTDMVITLQDASGTIQDAVLLTNDPARTTAAASSESQAAIVAAAGQWENVGGGTPPGGYLDLDFNMNAVPDLNDPGPETMQRIDNNDTNTKGDWTSVNATETYGALNVGQTDL